MKKSRILIITENIGKTAPGIVFERVISEISKRHDTTIICQKNFSGTNYSNLYETSYKTKKAAPALINKIQAYITKYSLIFFKYDFGALLKSIKINRTCNKIASNSYFDYVFTLISYNHTSPLLVAENIINKRFARYNISYFVDAIPAPIGWSVNNKEHRGIKYFISKRIKKLDGIFSSNAEMLDYQLGICNNFIKPPSSVLLNPIEENKIVLPFPEKEKYVFLYTGSIYGKRTAKHILNALKILLKNNSNIYLLFVGARLSEKDISILTEEERAFISIEPFTENLTPYYQKSIALLDIDADIDNDVFLSSKVTNYLNVNRIILSTTGKNSPAAKLLSNVESIIISPHDAESIANSMLLAIDKYKNINFTDRKELLEKFSIKNVIDGMEEFISKEIK